HIGIFNSNNEFPAMMPREQIVENGRSRIADMQMARRTRRVADADLIVHVPSPPSGVCKPALLHLLYHIPNEANNRLGRDALFPADKAEPLRGCRLDVDAGGL